MDPILRFLPRFSPSNINATQNAVICNILHSNPNTNSNLSSIMNNENSIVNPHNVNNVNNVNNMNNLNSVNIHYQSNQTQPQNPNNLSSIQAVPPITQIMTTPLNTLNSMNSINSMNIGEINTNMNGTGMNGVAGVGGVTSNRTGQHLRGCASAVKNLIGNDRQCSKCGGLDNRVQLYLEGLEKQKNEIIVALRMTYNKKFNFFLGNLGCKLTIELKQNVENVFKQSLDCMIRKLSNYYDKHYRDLLSNYDILKKCILATCPNNSNNNDNNSDTTTTTTTTNNNNNNNCNQDELCDLSRMSSLTPTGRTIAVPIGTPVVIPYVSQAQQIQGQRQRHKGHNCQGSQARLNSFVSQANHAPVTALAGVLNGLNAHNATPLIVHTITYISRPGAPGAPFAPVGSISQISMQQPQPFQPLQPFQQLQQFPSWNNNGKFNFDSDEALKQQKTANEKEKENATTIGTTMAATMTTRMTRTARATTIGKEKEMVNDIEISGILYPRLGDVDLCCSSGLKCEEKININFNSHAPLSDSGSITSVARNSDFKHTEIATPPVMENPLETASSLTNFPSTVETTPIPSIPPIPMAVDQIENVSGGTNHTKKINKNSKDKDRDKDKDKVNDKGKADKGKDRYIHTFGGRFDYQKANLYSKSTMDGLRPMWKCSLCDKQLVSQSGMVTHVQNKHRKELMQIKNRSNNNNSNNNSNEKNRNGDVDDNSSNGNNNNNNNGVGGSQSSNRKNNNKNNRIFIHTSKKDSDILANYKMTDDLCFECKQCGRIIATKSGCMTHLNIHKGIKKFQCSYCINRFNNRTSWLRHERTHTGEKPFECNVCKKRFLQKNTLKSHMATHTKEKNFVCQICNKKYTQSSSLRRHKKKMHK